ncbi:MAG: hypothetical protein KDK96_01345 [Chlamydiia bacterium]|nr:hypothetical protein [Chlamydiia bacterium]
MVGLANLVTSYPRVNEAAKDLIAATLGVGILRLVGMKLEVGQLSIKTLAFGAGTVAAGAALGREGLIQGLGAKIQSRTARNDMNKSPVVLLALAAGAVAAIAATQYSRVGAYLPTFTQLNRNQALALGSSAIGMLVGLRFFGFADQTKAERTPLPSIHEYSEDSEGPIAGKTVEEMVRMLAVIDGGQLSLTPTQIVAWDARYDELARSEDVSSIRKLGDV